MATITIDQLKKLNLTLPQGKCGKQNRCPVTYSLYDVLSSYFSSNAYIIYSDATISGNGSLASPLKIAQQSATSGQVLTWNGTTWVPQSPAASAQELSLVDDEITLTGGTSVTVGDLITADGSNVLTVGTDGLLKVSTAAGTLPVADTAGQIAYWTGAAWDVAIERREDFSPPAASNTITVAFSPIASLSIRVFLNGVLKKNLDDYTISGTLITFMYNFATNDKVAVIYYK